MDAPIRRWARSVGCSEPDCGNPHWARGYCRTHYMYAVRNGLIEEIFQECKYPGCDRARFVFGFCDLHYQRTKNGTPLDKIWPPPPSIRATHKATKKTWGTAANYPCAGCGSPAVHWAYDGTDQTERLGNLDGTLLWYSQWIEFYMPLCRKCHRRLDGARAASELREYREWKYETGMTLNQMTTVRVGLPNG